MRAFLMLALILTGCHKPERHAEVSTGNPLHLTATLRGLKSGVTMLDPGHLDSRAFIITGTIQNTSPQRLVEVGIKFDLYNRSGEKTGNLADRIEDIKPGDIWRFQIAAPGINPARIKFDGLFAGVDTVEVKTEP